MPAAKTSNSQNLSRVAKSLVGLQINPQIKAFNQQAQTVGAQGAAQQQRTVANYGNVAQAIKGYLANSQATGAANLQSVKDIGTQAQSSIADAYNHAQATNAADAGVRGGGLDGGVSARLRDEATAANARTVQDSQGAQDRSQNTSANYQGLLSQMMASQGARGADASQQIGYQTNKSLQDIATQKQAVEGTRGGLFAKTLQDLTQQEFNNYATQRGLNLQDDKVANALALGNSKLAQQAGEFGATLGFKQSQQQDTNEYRNAQIQLGHDRVDAQLHGQVLAHQDALARLANQGKLTPKQKIALQQNNGKIVSAIKSAADTLRAYKGAKDGKNHPLTPAAIKAGVEKQFGHDADLVNAAQELAKTGMISAHTHAILKARHIAVPKSWVHKGLGTASGASGDANIGG